MSRPDQCTSRVAVGANGHRCTLTGQHESRHRNGDLYWDQELIPNGEISGMIRPASHLAHRDWTRHSAGSTEEADHA